MLMVSRGLWCKEERKGSTESLLYSTTEGRAVISEASCLCVFDTCLAESFCKR
jgi:hypothetical protein